jgi:hypothetical protein
MRQVVSGHFVSPSSEDVLVSGSGCESHADDFGGSFLVTKHGLSWHKVRYVAGLIAFVCHKLTGSDGRDRLICGQSDTWQGDQGSSVCLHDPGVDLIKTDTLDAQFARGHALDNRGKCFFHVEDTTGGMGKSVQRGFIQRVEFGGIASRHQTRSEGRFARAGWGWVCRPTFPLRFCRRLRQNIRSGCRGSDPL